MKITIETEKGTKVIEEDFYLHHALTRAFHELGIIEKDIKVAFLDKTKAAVLDLCE